MAFCSYCGKELSAGAKFCFECGKPVEMQEETARKTVYSGEIHKCPQCGEVLNAYEAYCSACGYEIRGSSVSGYVQKFFVFIFSPDLPSVISTERSEWRNLLHCPNI